MEMAGPDTTLLVPRRGPLLLVLLSDVGMIFLKLEQSPHIGTWTTNTKRFQFLDITIASVNRAGG
jgi:hypothetical protein